MKATVDFNSLAVAEMSRAVTDQANYQNLLRNLSAGKEYDNETVLTICERAGRNVAMLQEDCKWRAERDRKIAELAKEDECRIAQKEADDEDTRLYQEFTKIEAEYDEKRWEQQAKCNQAKQKLQEISRYKKELKDDCRNPILHEEIERLEQQRQDLGSITFYNEQMSDIRREIMYSQQEIDRMPAFCPGKAEKVQHAKARIKDLEARCERIQTEIDAIERKENEIEAAKNEVYAKMILD